MEDIRRNKDGNYIPVKGTINQKYYEHNSLKEYRATNTNGSLTFTLRMWSDKQYLEKLNMYTPYVSVILLGIHRCMCIHVRKPHIQVTGIRTNRFAE